MSIWDYLRDKVNVIALNVLCMVLAGLFLYFVGNSAGIVWLVLGCWLVVLAGYFAADCAVKRRQASRLMQVAANLKEKYLLSEVVGRPARNEYLPYYRMLKMGNKAMLEKITEIKNEGAEYREYIEQWVHEIKTPLAVIKLVCENNKSETSRKILLEAAKTENFVEQALFYARSENVAQDYLVREMRLDACVAQTVQNNKQMFIANGVRVETEGLDLAVYSDPKWVEFILKQLLINAVQYRNADRPTVTVSACEEGEEVALTVRDNGIGILPSELPRVFEKGFTGSNGRRENKSTGIGLYLCSKLCARLGHKLCVQSEPGVCTAVTIKF